MVTFPTSYREIRKVRKVLGKFFIFIKFFHIDRVKVCMCEGVKLNVNT